MKHLVMILCLLAAGAAHAQQPTQAEMSALNEIFSCLAPGLPENWGRAHVLMTLKEPGSAEGNVRYMVAPLGEPDKLEPFAPCDPSVPARILIQLRDMQPAARRGWTAMQLEYQKSGSFRLNYEYPKGAEPKAAAKQPAKKAPKDAAK